MCSSFDVTGFMYKIIGDKSLNLLMLFHLAFMFYLCDGIFLESVSNYRKIFFPVVYWTSFTTSQHIPYLECDITKILCETTLVLPF